MKYFFLNFFIALTVSGIAFGQQTKSQKKLLTYRLGGTYGFGKNWETSVGNLIIYPETDSTVLFYIYVNRGKPSYHSGSLYGRMNITGSNGRFSTKYSFSDKGCKLSFEFQNKSIVVKTLGQANACGYGEGVQSDGIYKLISSYIPKYFETLDGDKVFFKEKSPEEYNSN